MVNISKTTLWNLLRLTKIHNVQLVKKAHANEFIKSVFVDDRYPDLSWKLIYKRVKIGIFRNQFDICDIKIVHVDTKEVLFHYADKIREDDLDSKINWDDNNFIKGSEIKPLSENLYTVAQDLIKVV